MFEYFGLGTLVVIALFLLWIWNSLYIIKEWDRGVVLRLARLLPEAKGAGVRLVFWPIETLYRITLRLETLDVPPHDIIPRDNVTMKVNAACYFRAVDRSLAKTRRCRQGAGDATVRHPAALPADLDRDRCREEHNDCVSLAYRYY